jgi:hypothetical protein
MRLLIEAARAGRNLLEIAVYDGSSQAEKIYQSLSVIGKKIEAEKKPEDAAAGKDALAGLARWPVTIQLFRQAREEGRRRAGRADADLRDFLRDVRERHLARAQARLRRFRHRRRDELARDQAREGVQVAPNTSC